MLPFPENSCQLDAAPLGEITRVILVNVLFSPELLAC
jgi:hypothetical protein